MKKITFLLMMLSMIAMNAQTFSISGKVTDEQQNPMPGASVLVKGTYIGASTNSNGEFKITNLKQGDYEIVVSFLSYEEMSKKISLTKDTKLDFSLKQTAIMSEEAIVSAIKANDFTPVAQTNLDKKDIDKQNTNADIPFMLSLTPSVVATSETGTGNGYTAMRIRGTDMSRINVTINGIPLNDAESQGVYWVNMPDFSSSVNAIQIQRGVGTSTNGAASFGASINFQTITIEPKPYANLGFSAGSFNTYKESVSAGTGLIKDKFTFDVRYSKLNADAYIQRGFSDHQSIYLSSSYYDEKNLLKAVVMLGKQQTGITWWGVPDYMIDSIRNFNPAGKYYDKNGNENFYDGQTDNYWQNHYQLLYTREISKKLSLNANLHATTGKGYYEQYIPKINDFWEENLFSNYGLQPIISGNDTVNSTDMIRQKWLDNVFYGFTSSLNYHYNKINASLGIAANKYDGDHFGYIKWMKENAGVEHDYEWYNNTGTKTDFNTFLKVQYSLTEKLSFYGDVQYRQISYKMEGPDDDLVRLDQTNNYNFVNPKFGINYVLNNNHKFYATMGIANREPNRSDLKEATKGGGTEVPTYETLYDYEAGYQFTKSKYAIGLNLYYMDYKNQLVNTGQLNSVGYPIMTNVDISYRTGVELMFGWKPIKNLEWTGNLTLSKNIIKNHVDYAKNHVDTAGNEYYKGVEMGDVNISYSPNIISASTISYKFAKYFTFNFISKYVGKQYIDNTMSEDRKLDAYFVNNVRLDFNKNFEKAPNLSIQFLVNNVFDVDYISNAYGGKWYETDGVNEIEKSWVAYFPQAGINFMFKLALSF